MIHNSMRYIEYVGIRATDVYEVLYGQIAHDLATLLGTAAARPCRIRRVATRWRLT
ncbi:MAG: hypothetical protein M1499_03245 [Firmicutes bacterium]|nr:hypothetical protein [Bacillota bacterium]MCL5971560.1 hypothetical protein [Bacillota bacterium]